MQLEKTYEPSRIEPQWAQWWVDEALYVADNKSDKPMFSLVVPPPNVTGALHMGHMFEIAMIDITMRWKRMKGYNVLWLPGTDHASIATEMLVMRHLRSQGIDPRGIGREKFLEYAWAWKEKYGGTIVQQLKRIGASCDWTRERFTMDEGLSRAVIEAFVRLYERGLIFRGAYMTNWCPDCGTAVSDLEVEYAPHQGHLWHIRYPIEGSGEYVVVATTRPETMLGDTAVAVNEKDERYKHLWGKTVTLPIMGRKLPIILDELAKPEFGTGVVKVTPAHDPNDYAAGLRHNLEQIEVIGKDGHMTGQAGPYAGLDRYEARKQVVEQLESEDLIVKIEDYTTNIGRCQRSKTVVEPRVTTQWFAKAKVLAEPAIKAVETGAVEIIPEQWRRNYFEWMYNIRDWCISRQLWWGHRVPAWYTDDGELIVARSEEEAREKAAGRPLRQDEDVLDTWFSSGLWPFSTMGWPEETDDLKAFYPTSLLNTGFDILFFWVARMIMLGLEMTGDVPFRRVYIHGLVRDADKQKMSKTKGNVIDPIEMTEKYGTDAVRFALVASAGQGSDVVLSEERIAGYSTFANKVWNAVRFVFVSLEKAAAEPWTPEQLDTFGPLEDPNLGEIPLEDRWIFSRLNEVAREVDEHNEKFRYHEIANTLYHFFWGEFCDWYIELKKLSFEEGSGLTAGWKNMLAAMERALRLLHPVTPFITEELWQRLTVNTPGRAKSISLASYPQFRESWRDEEAERKVAFLRSVITAVRNLRAELSIPPRTELTGVVFAHTSEAAQTLNQQRAAVARLANATIETFDGAAPDGKAMHHEKEFDLVLHLPDSEAALLRDRLSKQMAQLTKAKQGAERQLDNEKFRAKAPPHIVEGLEAKLAEYDSQLERIRATLSGLA